MGPGNERPANWSAQGPAYPPQANYPGQYPPQAGYPGYGYGQGPSKKSDQADSDSNMPKSTLRQSWTTSGANDKLVGLWQTSHSIVRIGGSEVTGYDLASGKQLFTVAPPGAGLVPCSASPTLSPAASARSSTARTGTSAATP